MGIRQSITTGSEGHETYSNVLGRVRPVKIEHSWSLAGIRKLCEEAETNVAISSPIFGASNLDRPRYKWRLVLYLRGDCELNRDYVSLYLQLVKGCQQESLLEVVKSRLSLAIVDADGVKRNWLLQAGKKYHFVKGRSLWGSGKFISRAELLDTSPTNKLLQGQGKNAKLTIICENSGAEATDDVPAECNLFITLVSEGMFSASSNLESLFQQPVLSDVSIRSSCGKEFRAHKAILAARSPVFAAMFQHEMREKHESVVCVEDMRRDVLEELLRFVYSGRVKHIKGTAYELLAAANMYAMQDLMALCEEVLFNWLTLENASSILVQADLHNAKSLKARVQAFIIEHKKDFVETQAFKLAQESHPHLFVEVFQKIAMQK